jgi:DNA-binding winged helix-turn-helix (wHTH) protein
MRFADCRLDLDARRLFRGAREVHLSPKAFELLKVLIESRPRAVSKTELLERVWAGIFVSEASLARAVNEIRDGVGDRARHSGIVRTVHGHGYAFAADVEDDRPRQTTVVAVNRAITCWLASAGLEVALRDGEHVAGRDPRVQIRLHSPKVSRHHARIVVKGSDVTVEDLGSKNGTFVSGKRVSSSMALKPGDEVRIGPFTFVFHVEVGARSTETEITRAIAHARGATIPSRGA